MSEIIIEVKNLKKIYKLGTIGKGTLTADLQSWWAKIRGKEDPNIPIIQQNRLQGDNFMALKGVSFSVLKGERVGIIGGNGAGKSTLLKILSRITTPTEGSATLRGRVTSMLEVGTGFNGEMTGRENIYMNGAILGMTKSEIDMKVDEIIEFSECKDFIDTPVKRYSSGMYVRLAFAIAAHLDSEILIADEVLAVGDIKFQKKCLGKMKDSANSEGKTVLYVSHNMATVRQLCDRVIVLKDGGIVYDGNVEDGIKIYSETSDNTSSIIESAINKNDIVRKKALFKKIELIGESNQIINPNIITINADVYSYYHEEDVLLRGVVFNSLGIPVGMYITKRFTIEKNEIIKLSFEIDVSCLSSDKYTFDVRIGTFFGLSAEDFDTKIQLLSFSILENEKQKNIIWDSPYYGNFCIPVKNMKLEKMNIL